MTTEPWPVQTGPSLICAANALETIMPPFMLSERGEFPSISSKPVRTKGDTPITCPDCEGCAARLASHRYFECLTLTMIFSNAVWIGVDIEANPAPIWTEAKPIFQIADNMFCAFFSFEVIVRFCAFRSKIDFWKDTSFLFDLVLVIFMVFETWVFAIVALLLQSQGGGAGVRQFTVLRLLRLLRLTRMGRLMRSMPEVMTMMKGLVGALRSVASTFIFQIGIMWVFGIIFTQAYQNDEGDLRVYFRRIGISMVTLFVQGTLLDELTSLAVLLKDDNAIMLLLFLCFVLLSSMMLLNMLIGVLTSGISATNEAEEKNLAVAEATRTLKTVFRVVDADGSQSISHAEFEEMLHDTPNGRKSPMMQAMGMLGIQEERLHELGRQLFAIEDPWRQQQEQQQRGQQQQQHQKQPEQTRQELSFGTFVDEVLKLTPDKAVSVSDIMRLQRQLQAPAKHVESCVGTISDAICAMMAEKKRDRLAVDNHDVACVADTEQSGSACRKSTGSKLSGVPTRVLLDELDLRLRRKQSSFDERGEHVL
eukprot:TRINITY_DN49407_c0_g1_i1.p1 TRINITY_DN49407_c0_g1~~TRINITY_DN49407_c0_g1_i1.p1  ORF type:complete len:607 (+),score=76.48 TRINITY_DN49407_c0_g1_i1:214-1821(+)